MKYPVIKYPETLNYLMNGESSKIITKPEPPSKPLFNKDLNENILNWPLYIVALCILLLVGSFMSDNTESVSVILIITFVCIIIVVFYNKEQKNIDNLNEIIKKNHNQEIKNFEQKLIDYEHFVLNFNNYYKTSQEVRKTILLDLMKYSNPPEPYVNNYKKGASERIFKHFLMYYFKDLILTDHIPVNYTKSKKKLFLPDFVLFIQELNIAIDVEIDEPYVESTNEPIHFFDCDEKRDNIFQSFDWIVVRFTEKQVISNPIGCCIILAETINNIYPNFFIIEGISDKFNLIEEDFWTEEEAVYLASINYRKSYFPDNVDNIIYQLENNINIIMANQVKISKQFI